MVGALGLPALESPWGPIINVFYVDGGCSRISVSTGQGAHHQCFFSLIVGAPGSPALAPPRGPAIGVFDIDGGRSRISVSTLQGGRHQCFLALMVGGLGSLTPPPRGPTTNVLQLSRSPS
jgi:hypothetical protein